MEHWLILVEMIISYVVLLFVAAAEVANIQNTEQVLGEPKNLMVSDQQSKL